MGLIGKVWVDLKARFWVSVVFYRDELKRVNNMEAVEFYNWAHNLIFEKFPFIASVAFAVIATFIMFIIFEIILV